MFAPLVAKAKSTGPQPAKAVDQTHTPRPSLGDQATSSFVAPEPRPGAKTTGSNAARAAGQGTARLWDFSKISLRPSGLAEQPQTSPLHWPPRLPIQAKLKVGAVDDPLEHEADRVADQVMRMPAPEVARTPTPQQVSRKGSEWQEEEKLQKKEAVPAAPALSEAPPSVHAALRSPGEPLDAAARAYFEPRFGRDLGAVRLHTQGSAAAAACSINARAYTLGHNIAFAHGEYAPNTPAGRLLLAHELAHVAQNRRSADGATVRRDPAPAEPPPQIVSEVWEVAGRQVVVVEVNGQRRAFYRRSTSVDKGRASGHVGPQEGDWAPFDGFSIRRDPKSGKVIDGYFEKNDYYQKLMGNDPLYGRGTSENLRIADWLKKQTLPGAEPAEWRFVQAQLQGLKVPVKQTLPEVPEIAPVLPSARSVHGTIEGGPGGNAVAEAAPEIASVAATSGARAVGRFLAREAPGLVLQLALMAAFPPSVNFHNEKMNELGPTKVNPSVQDALVKQVPTIDKLLNDQNSSKSVYANVTLDLDYAIDPSGAPDLNLYLENASFLDMKITNENVDTLPRAYNTESRHGKMRKTYSLLIYEAEGDEYFPPGEGRGADDPQSAKSYNQ